MRDDARTGREAEIAAAAYRLLEAKGFAGTSVQAIAREARASNETLYRWYGDKTGLFRALIDRNTAEVGEAVEAARASGAQGLAALAVLGPALLAMLLGARATALNRAAAADETGTLGATLSAGGRGVVAPLAARLAAEAIADGELCGGTPEEIAEAWLTLLIGDLQVRRVTGAIAIPTPEAIAARSKLATARLGLLYSPVTPAAKSLDQSGEAP